MPARPMYSRVSPHATPAALFLDQVEQLAETRLELLVQAASSEERAAHDLLLDLIQKQSGGRCVWRQPETKEANN